MKNVFIDLRDLYESYAMMINEDCVVISGLLVGLNVIDCNFDLKGEDLDSDVSYITYYGNMFTSI